jgi:iron complex outermembrane receptor protein
MTTTPMPGRRRAHAPLDGTLAARILTPIAALLAAAPAWSQVPPPQEAASSPAAPPPPAATAPAAAPPAAASPPATAANPPAAAASAAGLPTVIVTGEKTRRTLDRTAASVQVWSAADLDAAPGLRSSRALLENAVNVTATGTQNLAPAVRGIDGTGPSQGADAFLAGTRSRLNLVVDGRPATFNEISFGDLGLWDVSRVEVFRGAQSTLQGRNAIAGTIVYRTNEPSFERELAARAMVGNQGQRQLSALVSGPVVDGEMAFRVAVDRASSKSFVQGFTGYQDVGDPGEFDTRSARAKLLFKPNSMSGFRTLITAAHTEYRAPQAEGVARPFDAKVAAFPAMPVFAPRVNSGTVETTWALSDRWTFENSLVSGDIKVRRFAPPGDGIALIEGHDLSLEPRWRYASADGKLAVLLGLYAFDAAEHDTLDLFGGGAWDDKTTTRSAYGEATYALSPQWELTAGGRYEREHRLRQGTLAFFTTDFDETYEVFLPKLGLARKLGTDTTVGATVSRGYNGGNAGFTYDEPYINYTYDTEYVTSLEGYVRSRAQGGLLQLTGNVFYNRYKNFQTPFDLNDDPAVWAYVVRNAPRAVTYGAEMGAVWRARPDLTVRGDLGLLRAQIESYPDSNVEGHELPRSPRVSAALGATWRGPNGLDVGGSARYSSAYYSDITNVARGRVEPGWTAHLNASYPVGRARVFAFINNVFDSKRPVLVDADPNAAAEANDVGTLPRPRAVGVGVEVWF